MSRIHSSGGMCLHMPRSLLGVLFSSLFATLSLFATPPLLASWQHLPAGTASISTLNVDSTGQKIWIDATGAGVWLSENGGSEWQPASSNFVPEGGIRAYEFRILDAAADTLLARTANRHFGIANFYTFDGGETWTAFADNQARTAQLVDIWNSNHSVWFYFTWQGMYMSTDFGQTWVLRNNQIDVEYKLYQDSQHDSTLFGTSSFYDGGWLTCGLYRSDNLGQTWRDVIDFHELFGLEFGLVFDVLRLSNGDLLVTAATYDENFEQGACIFLSTDDGETWTTIEDPWEYNNPDHVYEDASIPGRLFVSCTCENGMYRSDDYGRTWSPAGGGLPTGQHHAGNFVLNPFSGDLFATYGAIWRSQDNGESWESLPDFPPVGYPFGQFAAFPDAVMLNVDGESGEYQWRLESPYAEWIPMSFPTVQGDTITHVSMIWYMNDDTMVAGTRRFIPGDSADMGTQISQVIYSHDHGESWQFGPPLDFVIELGIFDVFLDDTTVRIVVKKAPSTWSGADTLYISYDIGQTWTMAAPIENADYVTKVEQNATSIVALSETFAREQLPVYRSSDYGNTWESIGHVVNNNGLILLFGDTLFSISDGYTVCWFNGEWQQRGQIPLPHNSYSSWTMTVVPDGEPMLVGMLSDSTSLWTSPDHGYTWHLKEALLPYAEQNMFLSNLTYDPYRHRLWVSAGIGVCYLDAAELSADGPLVFKPADYTLLSIYPNPFNSETKIRFDLLKREQVSVRVYDVLGREVRTLVDERRDAGRHELNLSMSDAASGLYFVRIQTSEQARTQKIVLMK